MTRVLLVLCCMVLPWFSGFCRAADVPDPYKQILSILGDDPYVYGRYTQKRQLKGFARPLLSSGVFHYWKDNGLYWETQIPFYKALTYSEKAIMTWSEDGSLIATQPPSLVQRHMNRVLLAIFGANFDAIRELFQIDHFSQVDQNWELILTPADVLVAQSIERITLSGGGHLKALSVQAANGDMVEIEFEDVATRTTSLAKYCARFFEPEQSRCDR